MCRKTKEHTFDEVEHDAGAKVKGTLYNKCVAYSNTNIQLNEEPRHFVPNTGDYVNIQPNFM